MRAWTIENDGGVWRQRPEVYIGYPGLDDDSQPEPGVKVYDGEGGYEGLVAVLTIPNGFNADPNFYGFILDERMLPADPADALTP